MPEQLFRQNGSASCSLCKKVVHALILPSFYKSPFLAPPSLPSDPPAQGEASCFYNPTRRATKCCDHCGVYISDAWAAQWGSQTVCLKCLEELRSKNGNTQFEAKRILWDNVALIFSVGPWLIAIALFMTLILYMFSPLVIMLTTLTAPTAIFIALRYWNAPRSLVPRGRGRLVWATVFAVLQLIGWVALTVGFIYAVRNPGIFQ